MKPCGSGDAGSTAGAGGKLRENGRSQSGGFMDLVFEKLPYLDGLNGQACTAFSIAHYFKQNSRAAVLRCAVLPSLAECRLLAGKNILIS